MDKSVSDTGILKSSIKSLTDNVANITSTIAVFSNELRCRLDTFESKCVQCLEAQNQAYVRHIKDLEKGHEKKNDELDTRRSELVKMQATLYELMMDNRELHQEHEMLPSLSILEKKYNLAQSPNSVVCWLTHLRPIQSVQSYYVREKILF
jgi:chromosome segregation ATPase